MDVFLKLWLIQDHLSCFVGLKTSVEDAKSEEADPIGF